MRKVVLLVTLAFLTGCKLDLLSLASPSPAGHYSLDIARSEQGIKAFAEAEARKTQRTAEEIQRAAENQTKQAMAFLSTMTITMTLKEDGVLESVYGWGPFRQTSTGTWKEQDGKLILTTLQEDGQPLSQPKVEEAVYKGGDIYLTTQAQETSTAVVLTRSST